MFKLEEKFNRYYESLLNEVNRFDAKNLNVSTDYLYKFLETPQDLYTALKSNIIWSAYYDNKSGQYDTYCAELEQKTGNKYEYLCLTSEPTKVALEFKRPFGIEFYSEKLRNYVKDQNYFYKGFNQFDVKTKIAKDKAISNNYYLRLGTVGKFKDGTYFFTLQGGYEPRLISKDIYDQLVIWFKQNASDQLVHFVNSVDDPLKVGKGSKYIYKVQDFIADDSTIKYVPNKDNDFVQCTNKSFLSPSAPAGMQFRREFRDVAEVYAAVLNKAIGLKALNDGGYGTHIYNTVIPPIVDPQLNPDLGNNLSTEVYNSIGEALNEYEYRIYLPYKKDFKFSDKLVAQLKLPTVYELIIDPKFTRYINLQEVFNAFNEQSNLSDDDMLAICNRLQINHEAAIKQIINLYKLIQQKNLKYSFYDYTTGINPKRNKYYNIEHSVEDTYAEIPNKLIHNRFIANKGSLEKVLNSPIYDFDKNPVKGPLPDNIQLIKLADANGYPTLLYRTFSPSNDGSKEACARIGVEGLILGKDENETWYLRLMNKSATFCELPGGSLEDLNNLTSRAKEKLSGEAGFNLPNINGPIDTIYMYENPAKPLDATIGKKLNQLQLQYPYSAYLLFSSILNEPISPEDKSYYSKNNDVARWIPVDSLETNRNFMSRYANLLPIINKLIK